jgi:hypothetical protein
MRVMPVRAAHVKRYAEQGLLLVVDKAVPAHHD